MAQSLLVKRHYDALVKSRGILTRKDVSEFLDHIGSECVPDSLRASIVERLAGHDLNIHAQRSAAKIARIAPMYGNLPDEIFVGKYPTGSFNAQVMKTIDGPLVLIHDGADYLIIEIVKLFVAGAFIFSDSPESVTRADVQLGEHEVAEQLARYLYAYVVDRDPSSAKKLPPPNKNALIIVAMLADSASQFLIAHEYGHIIKGHLDSHPARSALGPNVEKQFELDSKSLEQEVEADYFGLRMHNALTLEETGDQIDTTEKLLQLQLRFAGPTIFFSIADLIEEAFKSLVDKRGYLIVGDHPPSTMRMEYTNKVLSQISGDKALEMASAFDRWLGHYRDRVLDFITKIV